jgi:ATP-dependent RNA helicase SUPV3L1/SUV3
MAKLAELDAAEKAVAEAQAKAKKTESAAEAESVDASTVTEIATENSEEKAEPSVAEATAPTEALEAPAEDAACEPAQPVALDTTGTDEAEDSPGTDTPSGDTVATESTPAAIAEPKSDAGPVEEAKTEQEEEKFILLWRPGYRGGGHQQRRHSRDQEGGREHRRHGKPRGEKGGKPFRGKGKGGRHDGQNKAKPMHGGPQRPRPEKAPDPDSPFAKLAALKEKLGK